MEDYNIVPTLKESLQEFYNSDRGGIHVSDLVYCQRKQIFRKLKPMPLTDAELNNFSSGRGIHGALEALAKRRQDRYELEKEVWLGDVVAHIDIYDKKLDMPIEAKTYRTLPNNIPNHSPPDSQIQQLKFYMAMTNTKVGILLGQYINDFKEFPFKERIIRLSDMELKLEREKLLSRAAAQRKALASMNPADAPHVMGNPEYQFLCKNCPYYKECSEINTNSVFKNKTQ